MTDLLEIDDADIDILCDALEAWENKDMAVNMMADLMESVMADRNERASASFANARAATKDKADREKRERKSASVILRAKLLTIRAGRSADSALRRAVLTEAAK